MRDFDDADLGLGQSFAGCLKLQPFPFPDAKTRHTSGYKA
jgi:hypothetical protein